MKAAEGGHSEVVDFLLSRGADIEAHDMVREYIFLTNVELLHIMCGCLEDCQD